MSTRGLNVGTWPSVDHSLLSPSGKMSKIAKERAQKRLLKELFPEGLEPPTCRQPTEKEYLLRKASELRELANRGFKPRAYLKEAIRLEELAK